MNLTWIKHETEYLQLNSTSKEQIKMSYIKKTT